MKIPTGTANESDVAVTQVTVVVADLEAAMVAYSTTFGWGPWTVYDFRELDHDGVEVVRVAIARVGGIDLELLEPIGPSPYQDALAARPGGLDHIQVVSPTSSVVDRLSRAGAAQLLSGRFPGFGYTIFDLRERAQLVAGSYTGDVATIVDLPHRVGVVRDGAVSYLDRGTPPPVRTSTVDVVQVGMVVESVDETLKGLRDLFGWGPWRVYDFRQVDHTGTTYRGAPFDYAMRIATVRAGDVHIELIEPTGPGPYRDFLDTAGPGLHHLQVQADEPGEARRRLETAGWSVHMSGHVGLDGPAGLDYVLFEHPAHGHFVEITQGDRSRLLTVLPFTEQ